MRIAPTPVITLDAFDADAVEPRAELARLRSRVAKLLERLKRYLAAPLTLYLGTADDAPDENFDASAEATLQGSGSHQRGLACYWYAQGLAAARGWPCAWQLVEAPGDGHDHEKMFEHERCALALFGTPTGTTPTSAGR